MLFESAVKEDREVKGVLVNPGVVEGVLAREKRRGV